MLLLAFAFATSGFCQESNSKKINKIKRDSQYLYAEATTKDANEAYETALELLNGFIDEYVQSKKKYNSSENIIIKDVRSHYEQIQMQRGDLTRVFVYVKKSDIIPADNSTIRENVGKKEEPDTDVSVEEHLEGDASLRLEKAWQQEIVDQLLACNTIVEAKSLLNRRKAEYKVKRIGTPDSCRNKETCFWVIGDESGKLLTVLGKGSDKRTNFKTLELDSLENYSNAKAIWFTMSE